MPEHLNKNNVTTTTKVLNPIWIKRLHYAIPENVFLEIPFIYMESSLMELIFFVNPF